MRWQRSNAFSAVTVGHALCPISEVAEIAEWEILEVSRKYMLYRMHDRDSAVFQHLGQTFMVGASGE